MKRHEQDIPAAPNEKGVEGVVVLEDGTVFRGGRVWATSARPWGRCGSTPR